MNVTSFCSFWNYRIKWPFYKDYMTLYVSCLTGIFFWGNLTLIFGKILENTHFEGILEIYFLGLPIILFLIIFAPDERINLVHKNINNIQNGEEMSLQV